MKAINVALLCVILATSCTKQGIETGNNLGEEDISSKGDREVTTPTVQNGILVFANYESYRAYHQQQVVSKAQSRTVPQPQGSGFYSMQNAYDDILEDDARVGDSLEQNYPVNDPATYDNTHTYLASIYSSSIYQAGDATNGYRYELNCFDRSVAPELSPDGLIKIGSNIYQYTKDYYKVWVDGDISSTSTLKNSTQNNNSDIYVVNKNSPSTAFATKTDTVAMYNAWDNMRRPSNSIFLYGLHTSCENTKTISLKKKKVIGYVNFDQYFRPEITRTRPIRFRIWWSVNYTTTERSLKGRLFGAWFDDWKTGHHQEGTINADTQIGFGGNTTGSPTAITTSWGYYDYVQNNIHTSSLVFPAYDMTTPTSSAPDQVYRWEEYTTPTNIKGHTANFLAAAGMVYPNDNPNCSCSLP